MKKISFTLLGIIPALLFASDSAVEFDILERTVNFFIFAAIIYYLLSDKLKAFFVERTSSIQSELDKVQEILKESDKKLVDAKQEVLNARKVAEELITTATSEIKIIKRKIEKATVQEITNLENSFDEKTKLEVRKVKKEVVENVLNQLLSNDNIDLSQKDLADIILKKVA
jgi:F-type H+-transporting ATPase subunit b